MPESHRSLLSLLAPFVLLAPIGCRSGAATPPTPAAADAPVTATDHVPAGADHGEDAGGSVDAVRTVVEHDLGGALMVIEVVEIGADSAATLAVRTEEAGVPLDRVLVIEEIVVGDDHYIHAPDAEVVFGVDLWVHVDSADPRQRAFLEQQGPALAARAAVARAGDAPGVRIERVRRAPIRPPSGRVVPLPELDEVPELDRSGSDSAGLDGAAGRRPG